MKKKSKKDSRIDLDKDIKEKTLKDMLKRFDWHGAQMLFPYASNYGGIKYLTVRLNIRFVRNAYLTKPSKNVSRSNINSRLDK